MNNEQRRWLEEHGDFALWTPAPMVTFWQWTDVGFVSPSGHFVPDGKGVPFMPNVRSAGDTLSVIADNSIKVGRKYLVV